MKCPCNWWVLVRNPDTRKEIVQFVHEVRLVLKLWSKQIGYWKMTNDVRTCWKLMTSLRMLHNAGSKKVWSSNKLKKIMCPCNWWVLVRNRWRLILSPQIIHIEFNEDQMFMIVWEVTYWNCASERRKNTLISTAFQPKRALLLHRSTYKKYIDHQWSFCIESKLSIGIYHRFKNRRRLLLQPQILHIEFNEDQMLVIVWKVTDMSPTYL